MHKNHFIFVMHKNGFIKRPRKDIEQSFGSTVARNTWSCGPFCVLPFSVFFKCWCFVFVFAFSNPVYLSHFDVLYLFLHSPILCICHILMFCICIIPSSVFFTFWCFVFVLSHPMYFSHFDDLYFLFVFSTYPMYFSYFDVLHLYYLILCIFHILMLSLYASCLGNCLPAERRERCH